MRYVTAVLCCASIWFVGGACGGTPSKPIDKVVGIATVQKPPQNDDYISTYGREATGATRRAIATLVRRYYAAAAADNGALACTMLITHLAHSVPEDYGQPPGPVATRGKTCPVVMAKFFKHVPGQPFSTLAATSVTGVRILGSHAFVQLTSKALPTGEISILHERGGWRVEALIGVTCKNCAAR